MGENRSDRIKFLDGLRGIAIIAVILYHAYGATYSQYLPFGQQFSVIPLRLFWVGVQLFFIISGFVIVMTLERCDTITNFAIRRWLRLFPAMLVASLLILTFDRLIGIGPYVDRTAINLLPGILFISPSIIHAITGTMIESMDGPFWSLYVEVTFYAIFGASYFLVGARRAIALIFGLFVISCCAHIIADFGFGGQLFARIAAAMSWLGLVHFGWFASGALFYEYAQRGFRSDFIAAILAGGCSAVLWAFSEYGLPEKIAMASMVGIFALALTSIKFQQMLSNRILVFFGFISYPLYLVHNNILVGLTSLFHRSLPIIPDAMTPVLPISGVVFVAWLIAKYAEGFVRTILRYPFRRHSFQVPKVKTNIATCPLVERSNVG